jgi:hypothetical protein
MRILKGMTCETDVLYYWMAGNTNHLDVNDRHIIAESFSVFGELTSIGNVLPFCHAVLQTDMFRNMMYKSQKNIGTFDAETSYANVPYSIMTLYAQVYCCATLAGDDDFAKTMTHLQGNMTAFRRTGYRGAFTHWKDFNGKLNLPEDYYPKLCSIGRTIVPNHLWK